MFRGLMSGFSSLLSSGPNVSAPPDAAEGGIEVLPEEVLVRILLLLDRDSLAIMRLVCASWSRHSGQVVKTLSPKVLKKQIARGPSFASLATLDLSQTTGVTDQKLGVLADLRNLRHLKMKRCRNVSDMGLGQLAKLDKLESLNLARCLNISDEGVALLVAGATSLQTLNIKFCYKITNTGIAALAGLHSLTSLNCSHCRLLSDVGLRGLTGLNHLKTLKISDCDQITDYGIEAISGMSSLTALHASIERTLQQQKTDESLSSIGRNLVNLVTLKYTLGGETTMNGIRDMASLPKLKELRLGRVGVPMDELFDAFGQMTSLETLRLNDCGDILEGSMDALTSLQNLRLLSLGANTGAKLHDSGIEVLASMDKLEALSITKFNRFRGMPLRGLTKLKKLDLVMCNSIQQPGIDGLTVLKGLKSLCISYNPHITDDSILSFAQMTALESLTLCECLNVTGNSMLALAPLTGLKKLTLSFCGKLCDGGMHQISQIPSVTDLTVAMCTHVTDRGILALAKSGKSNLRHLNIAGCDLVTLSAQKKLQERLPQLTIEKKSLHPTLIHMLGIDGVRD